MLDYQYSYLVGALIFAAAWAVLYKFGKQHRAQIVWGSLLAVPFAFTGFLFIPEYWNPPSLFNWAERFGISIEDVIWSGAVGGIASALSEILFHQRLEQARTKAHGPRYKPLFVAIGIFVALEFVRPAQSIYNMMIAFAAGAAVIAILRRDLIGRMLRGATVFMAVYLALFVYLLALYPDFIARYYNIEALLGVYVFGVPIEELLFAWTGGTVWTVLYEYVNSYRLVSAFPPAFVRDRL